jgi:hypothetical protein
MDINAKWIGNQFIFHSPQHAKDGSEQATAKDGDKGDLKGYP